MFLLVLCSGTDTEAQQCELEGELGDEGRDVGRLGEEEPGGGFLRRRRRHQVQLPDVLLDDAAELERDRVPGEVRGGRGAEPRQGDHQVGDGLPAQDLQLLCRHH